MLMLFALALLVVTLIMRCCILRTTPSLFSDNSYRSKRSGRCNHALLSRSTNLLHGSKLHVARDPVGRTQKPNPLALLLEPHDLSSPN